MEDDVKHIITVRKEYRVGGKVAFRAICSCNRYSSGLSGYPGFVEKAGNDHKKAKEAQEAERGETQ